MYGGGATAYDAGKTPMAFNTPGYNAGGEGGGWGAGGNTPYEPNNAFGKPNWGQNDADSHVGVGWDGGDIKKEQQSTWG